MGYTNWVLGKEKAQELLLTIQDRIVENDTSHLIDAIISNEVSKVVDSAPFSMLCLRESILEGRNPYANGLVVAALKEKFEQIQPTDTDNLKKELEAIIQAVRSCYFGTIYVEIGSEIREWSRKK